MEDGRSIEAGLLEEQQPRGFKEEQKIARERQLESNEKRKESRKELEKQREENG